MRKTIDETRGLNLRVEDTDDLSAASAYVQDAILRVGDIAFLARKHRLALSLNRFCWERPPEKLGGKTVYRRVTAGLHFETVLSVKTKGIVRHDPEALLYVLAIKFEPADATGTIEISFAGGATLRAEVEAIEGVLRDVDTGWLTDSKPEHEGSHGGREGRP
ncbi:MAG: DUF2948 family protein [Alphaproteobacteria bacterium]